MSQVIALNPPKTLPEKLRWARKRAGLSLDGLAEKAGTSRQYLIALEKGRHTPSDEMLARIAIGCDQPIEFFLGTPTERLEQAQRDRLASALKPFVDSLADELLALVREQLEVKRDLKD